MKRAESIRPRSDAERRMAGYLARIATGPELSQDLSREEARDGMELILRGEVDPAQAAVFLIALRMKRESHDELCGVLQALRGAAKRTVAPVAELVDMAEPYNGYVRHLPAAPFVPAVLAACGVPCVLHGICEVGPKWGVTAHRILGAAGAAIDLTPAQASACIAEHGWAYLDQTISSPGLAGLARLRTSIVKRPCLSLVEKLIAPVRAREQTHLWIGYAHREYPEILYKLARDFGYASMLAVRGVEGGVTTSLSGRVAAMRYRGESPLEPVEIAPSGVIGPQKSRAPSLPQGREDSSGRAGAGPPDEALLERWASRAAECGIAALSGQAGPTQDMLILAAAAVLRHLGKAEDLARGGDRARSAIRTGEALERFRGRR